MSTNYAKPEHALRRAKDLEKAGKVDMALKNLHNILTIKRYKLFSDVHEDIMKMYVDLSVEKRYNTRDAFIQFRGICQEAHMDSLEGMLKYYLELVEQKAKAVMAQTGGSPVALADDEELEDTPEAIMLKAVSGEDAKARADRQLVTPWLRYLWDAYRTALDVLRNISHLEAIYHGTARRAFKFCLDFKRTTEFRKLCDSLRRDVQTIEKWSHQNHLNSIDLNSQETQRYYLETRFEQLNIASALELWQEAYRTIEDIHISLTLSPAAQPASLLVTYYDKLAQIFWASDNTLFHAYSLNRHLQLLLQCTPALDADSRRRHSTAVLLATLASPLQAQDEETFFQENDGGVRLADLVGFKKETPTRARLLANLGNVLHDATDEGKAVYNLLEKKFGPLTLAAQLAPLFTKLSQDPLLARYVDSLKQLTVVRLLQQLSTIYSTIKMSRFISLCPTLPLLPLEHLVMNAVKQGAVSCRFDHQNALILFGSDTFESQRMRNQLFVLAERLQQVVSDISPVNTEEQQSERQHVFKVVRAGLDREHQDVFRRKEDIEQRKQARELQQQEAKRREDEDRATRDREFREAQAKRLADEKIAREQAQAAQAKKDAEEVAKKAAAAALLAKADALANKVGQKALKKAAAVSANIENLDRSALVKAQQELIEKEREERDRRMREQWKRLDYMTRALRLEERETLRAEQQRKNQEEKKAHEEAYQKRLAEHRELHQKALAEKKRMLRMLPQKNEYHKRVMQRRNEIFQVQKKAEDERLAKLAEKRRIEREQREAEEEAQREEEERLAAEEAAAEEERRIAKEKADEEKRKAAEEAKAKQAKLDEAMRKQREREAELDARDAARRSVPPPADAASTGRWSRDDDGPRRPAVDVRADWGRNRDREQSGASSDAAGGGSTWRANRGAGGGDRDRERDRDRDAPPRDRDHFGSSFRDRPAGGGGAGDRGRFSRDGDRERDSSSRDGGRFSRDSRDRPDDRREDRDAGSSGSSSGGGAAWRSRAAAPAQPAADRPRERSRSPPASAGEANDGFKQVGSRRKGGRN